MTPPGPARAPGAPFARLLASLLAALLVVLGAAAWQPTRAHADQHQTPLQVTLTAQTPSGGPTDTVVVRGQVENTSQSPVSEVQVHLWRSSDQLADTTALDEVLASSPENPLGRRMLGAEAGNIFNITDVGTQKSQAFTAPKASLAPGEKADFEVRGTVAGADSLGFTTPGAYLMGVQVRGIPQGQQNQTVGRARSLFVQTGRAATAVHRQAAPVVLLTARPSMTGEGVFADNSLSAELQGRLSALLSVATQQGSTVLVDPALFDELTAMAAGYRVVGSSDETATARGQQAAKDFLAKLTPLLSSGRAYRTLYGSPDVALALGSGRRQLLTRSAQELAAEHPLARLPLAVVPADGRLDQATAEALEALTPAVVLASNTVSSAPVQRHAGLTVVHYEPAAMTGGPGPEPSNTPAQVAARLQAQQYLSPRPMVSLVSTEAQARAELAPTTWRTRTSLASLVSASPEQPRAAWLPGEVTAQDPRWSDGLDAAQADLEAWGELVGEQELARVRSERILSRALSTTWGGDRDPALAWLARTRSQVAAVLNSSKVQLKVVSDFVTSASDQEIPVTVTNGLSDRIRVKVVFSSENSQRISIADSEVRSIGPGESETIRVKVLTRANGQVGVTARLATAEDRLIGQPREMTITATQAGRVGWIIIIASGVVLLAGTAIRIRQVQAERRDGREHGQGGRSTLLVVSPEEPAPGTLDETRR
ncbi:DUF6049 family protein [Luteococcus peritonei]|uniref:DUF6049 family protein n=1 Tax=Luteococcus peritonei TaxID=88874 RepID=A0ABW4RV30_9ACTN